VAITDNAELRCKTTKDKKQKTKTKIKDNHHPIITLSIDIKGRELNEGQIKVERRPNEGQMRLEAIRATEAKRGL
jgi:hypothetical protein